MSKDSCMQTCLALVRAELEKSDPDLVPISICLGVVEAFLTNKKQQSWPSDLKSEVERGTRAVQEFVSRAARKLQEQGTSNSRAKVKVVADLIWTYLTGVFSKDVQHAQHIYSFTQMLAAGKQQGKRHLDCAGVVTTTLAVCLRLSVEQQHADLALCRLQVSEDHCWVNFDPEGSREGTVEVTTDTTAKRGQEITEGAWQGWLYTGGHAVLCTPKMAVTALVASLNPSINPRQNTGTDSEELQQLQHDLLQLVHQDHPEAMYPAALCTLADLVEICQHDKLQAALAANSREEVCNLLERRDNDAQELFEEAVRMSKQPGLGFGRAWYPFSYLIGYLTRRAQFILKDGLGLLGQAAARAIGDQLLRDALRCCGTQQGAAVLKEYRYAPVDEQLQKDIEGVLEMLAEVIKYLHECKEVGGFLTDHTLLTPVLEFWDGICWFWSGRPKPTAWIGLLLKTAKLFSPEARQQAAAVAEVNSQVMLQTADLWTALKIAQIRPLFEAADVQSGADRGSKRARR